MKLLRRIKQELDNIYIYRTKGNMRRSLSMLLACIVVFVTVYQMILPALTLELTKAQQTPGIYLEKSDLSEETYSEDIAENSSSSTSASEVISDLGEAQDEENTYFEEASLFEETGFAESGTEYSTTDDVLWNEAESTNTAANQAEFFDDSIAQSGLDGEITLDDESGEYTYDGTELTAECGNDIIILSYDASARIPDGSVFTATRLQGEEAAPLEASAEQAILGSYPDCTPEQTALYKLSISGPEGETIYPAGQISVTILFGEVIRADMPIGVSYGIDNVAVLSSIDMIEKEDGGISKITFACDRFETVGMAAVSTAEAEQGVEIQAEENVENIMNDSTQSDAEIDITAEFVETIEENSSVAEAADEEFGTNFDGETASEGTDETAAEETSVVPDGEADGTSEDETDRTSETETDGTSEAETDGTSEGETDGTSEPETDGTSEPETDGTSEAETDGTSEAETDGTSEAETDGTPEEGTDETSEAETDGTSEEGTDETSEDETDGTTEAGTDETSEDEIDGTPEAGTDETSEAETDGTSEAETGETSEEETGEASEEETGEKPEENPSAATGNHPSGTTAPAVSGTTSLPAASADFLLDVPGKPYSLHISYDETAGIPAGAEFVATPLEDDDYASQAIDLVTEETESDYANLIGLFDLTIYFDGKVIVPTGPVKIEAVFEHSLENNEEIYAVHFPGTGEQPQPEDAHDAESNISYDAEDTASYETSQDTSPESFGEAYAAEREEIVEESYDETVVAAAGAAFDEGSETIADPATVAAPDFADFSAEIDNNRETAETPDFSEPLAEIGNTASPAAIDSTGLLAESETDATASTVDAPASTEFPVESELNGPASTELPVESELYASASPELPEEPAAPELIPVVIDGNAASFETESFSYFALVGTKNAKAASAEDGQTQSDVVGRYGLTNTANVKVYSGHNLVINTQIDTIEAAGTRVTILGMESGSLNLSSWYQITYVKNEETITSYVETKYIDIPEMADPVSGENDAFKATASWEKGVLPEGTLLEAGEPSLTEEERKALENQALSVLTASPGKTLKVTGTYFFDLSFMSEGAEIEPNGEVNVSMELKQTFPTEENESLHLVHFTGSTGTAELLEKTAFTKDENGNLSKIDFTVGSFSTFVVVRTIEKNILASDGHNYRITVSYGTETEIPENADLEIEEILSDSEEYYSYLVKAEKALGWEEGTAGYARLFDICIVDPEDPETHYQPAEGSVVELRIELADYEAEAGNVVHFEDEPRVMETEKDANAFSLETDSFSVYAVVSSGETTNLDGKTFAIVNTYNNNALKNINQVINNQQRLQGTGVRTQEYEGTTYVSGTDVALWKFARVNGNVYYIQDENGKYLNIGSNYVRVSDTPQAITVATDTRRPGKVRLRVNNYAINDWNNTADAGFYVGTYNNDGEWFTLFSMNEVLNDWAKKISVTDLVSMYAEENPVKNVIVYTRIWNQETEVFDYYAVTEEGFLVPVQDVGDSIGWVTGLGDDPEKWDMIVHTTDGSPNGYFDFMNESLYLLPSAAGIQAQDDPDDSGDLGINMEGWSLGNYATTMRHWDAGNSAYYGFSYDPEQMKLISTTDESRQIELFFAVADPSESPYANQELHEVTTLDGSEQGITIKMYDFDGTHLSSFGLPRSYEMTQVLGTNSQASTNVNGVGYANTGLVNAVLGNDDFPVASQTGTSLGRLFSSSNFVAEANNLFVRQVYDETGYFQYDSSKNYAYLDQTAGKFILYREVAAPAMEGTTTQSGQKGNFFPFDSLEALAAQGSVFADRTVQYDGDLNLMTPDNPQFGEILYKVPYPNTSNYNSYFFGMTMEADFYQGPDGKDQKGNDTVYEFNGDDDMWVFIDGVRILDIGGCHGAVSGTINFATGVVKVNGAYPFETTIKELFRSANRLPNGDRWNETEAAKYFKGNTFADYTQHSFKMFYLERGAYASNLKVNFNLLTVEPGTFVLEKKLPDSVQQEYGDTLFAYQIFVTGEGGQETLYTPPEGKHVIYEGSGERVVPEGQEESEGFKKSLTIGEKTFSNVYLLKPDEAIIIPVSDKDVQYYVREIGIDKSVYESVYANGTELAISAIEGTDNDTYPIWAAAVDTSTVQNRGRVTYENIPREESVHNLRIRKVIDSPVEDPDARFRFDVSLESWNTNGLVPYRNGIYYIVKTNDSGEDQYYKYAGTELVEADEPVPMRAGLSGSIVIPADYTILIKGLMASADFLVTENLTESSEDYTYVSTTVENAGPVQVEGSLGSIQANADNIDALVTITNRPHNYIIVEKNWESGTFVTEHADIYAALYSKTGTGEQEVLTLVPDSVQKLTWDEGTEKFRALFYLPDVEMDKYVVREVQVTLDQNGNVVSVDDYIEEGSVITLTGETTVMNDNASDSYVVHYEAGEEETVTDPSTQVTYTTRTDKVTNILPKVSLYKINENTGEGKRYLSGAVFAWEDKDGNPVKDSSENAILYTSDENGMLFEDKYFSDGVYYFHETKAPDGYILLDYRIVLKVSGGRITAQMEEPGMTIYSNQIDDSTVLNKEFRFEIMNNPGYELPATGGPGTTLYYLLGSILSLAAAALLTLKSVRRALP